MKLDFVTNNYIELMFLELLLFVRERKVKPYIDFVCKGNKGKIYIDFWDLKTIINWSMKKTQKC